MKRMVYLGLGLAMILILAGCTVEDLAIPVGQDDTVWSTSVPVSDYSTTPYPVESFDLDGDGKLGPAEVKAAVISQAGAYEFAPGYEFDATRYGLKIDRILDTDWRTFSFDYPATEIVPPQACSWVRYWLDSNAIGDSASVDDALDKMRELSGDEALGSLAGPFALMVDAAEDGDLERVEAVFIEANCHLTLFVPVDFGPQGNGEWNGW